jgi:hypothetical protein
MVKNPYFRGPGKSHFAGFLKNRKVNIPPYRSFGDIWVVFSTDGDSAVWLLIPERGDKGEEIQLITSIVRHVEKNESLG